MITRIGIQNKSGKSISYISCDIVDCVKIRNILLTHFKTRQKVFRLISGGDLSNLGSRITPRKGREHTGCFPQKDVCVYYIRDFHETSHGARTTPSVEGYRKRAAWDSIPFAYYMDNDNVWWESVNGKKFKKINSVTELKPIPDINKALNSLLDVVEQKSENDKENTIKISFKIRDKKTREEILDTLKRFDVDYVASVVD